MATRANPGEDRELPGDIRAVVEESDERHCQEEPDGHIDPKAGESGTALSAQIVEGDAVRKGVDRGIEEGPGREEDQGHGWGLGDHQQGAEKNGRGEQEGSQVRPASAAVRYDAPKRLAQQGHERPDHHDQAQLGVGHVQGRLEIGGQVRIRASACHGVEQVVQTDRVAYG